MEISDWIGFAIAMTFVAVSIWRHSREAKKRPPETPSPEETEIPPPASTEDENKWVLDALGIEIEEERPKPSAPAMPLPAPKAAKSPDKARRKLSDDFQFQATLDARHQKTNIESRSYDTRVQPQIAGDYESRLVSKDLRLAVGQKKEKPLVKLGKVGKAALRQYVVGQEVLGLPRAFRRW